MSLSKKHISFVPLIWGIAFGFLLPSASGISLILFASWYADAPAVPEEKQRKIKLEMTKEETLALLGKPRLIDIETRPNYECWLYGSEWQAHSLVLIFSKEGKLLSWEDED